MSQDFLGALFAQALTTALQVAGPIVLACLVAGLVVSILQAATQVNDPVLSFVPKLVAAAAVALLLGPWMATALLDFTVRIFRYAAGVAGG